MGATLDAAVARLERAGVPMARREAERLLAWVLDTDRGGVAARRPDDLEASSANRFEGLLRRRERREPIQYLTGEQEFYGLTFRVDARVLVPRPETEGVVDAALALPLGDFARVADLGTGSGCIAVSLAVKRPRWTVLAVERSAKALAVARDNAERNAVGSRIEFVEDDAASPRGAWAAALDAVVSNPPYVSESEWRELAPEVRDYEPKEALVPGPTGLEAYRALAPVCHEALRAGGWLVLELGHQSEAGARVAVAAAGFVDPRVIPDLRGIPRVLVARRPGAEGSKAPEGDVP